MFFFPGKFDNSIKGEKCKERESVRVRESERERQREKERELSRDTERAHLVFNDLYVFPGF